MEIKDTRALEYSGSVVKQEQESVKRDQRGESDEKDLT